MEHNHFKNGDIVYWCNQTGYKYSVHWGRVEEQNGDIVFVDYLVQRETRTINGIPFDEFPEMTHWKKLPKGWTYDTKLFEKGTEELSEDESDYLNKRFNIKNPSSIKEGFDLGYLVLKSKIFPGKVEPEITKKDGWRLVKKTFLMIGNIPSVSIQQHRLYNTYEEAEKEVKEYEAEYIRQSNLSDYEWSVEQIDKELKRWCKIYGITESECLKYREWLLKQNNVEEIEVRVFRGRIQWKHWKSTVWRWIEP